MQISKIGQEELIVRLIKEFPTIEPEILDEDYVGLLSLQVGCLAHYTNRVIEAGQLNEVGRIFRFFEQVVDKVDDKVNNALFVAFLEHVELGGNSENARQARKLLSPYYVRIWEQLQ